MSFKLGMIAAQIVRLPPAASRLTLAAALLPVLALLLAGRAAALPLRNAAGIDLIPANARFLGDAAGSTLPGAPDAGFEVPWNGTLWQSTPNFTWASCDVAQNTRKAIDIAISQWSYAGSNQGLPIRLTESTCSNGSSQAQVRIFEASSTDLPGVSDHDVFGLTLVRDQSGRVCGVDVPAPCVAQAARIYLFTDNWQTNSLSYAQAAKTVAHEMGHALGLGHAHFCNFDSIMAQSCEPILQGLGPDDIQSLDSLVDYTRVYFNQAPLRAQSIVPQLSGGASVIYRAGYNLVAGPRGTTFGSSRNVLYTLLPDDASYRTLSTNQPIYAGFGYWAYFPQDVTVPLNGVGRTFYSILGIPGMWFMIGNESGTTTMRVAGAQSVVVYDSQSGQYRSTDIIPVGQGAWVKPDKDGLIAVYATSLSKEQVRCYLDLGSPSSC